MQRTISLHLDDLAKSSKSNLINDVHEVPEDIASPQQHLAAGLSADGNAVICDEIEPLDAGSKRDTCGSGGTAAAASSASAAKLDGPRGGQAASALPPLLLVLAEAMPETVFTAHVPHVYIVILGGKPGSGPYTVGGLVTDTLEDNGYAVLQVSDREFRRPVIAARMILLNRASTTLALL
jgi:hypothetical protein